MLRFALMVLGLALATRAPTSDAWRFQEASSARIARIVQLADAGQIDAREVFDADVSLRWRRAVEVQDEPLNLRAEAPDEFRRDYLAVTAGLEVELTDESRAEEHRAALASPLDGCSVLFEAGGTRRALGEDAPAPACLDGLRGSLDLAALVPSALRESVRAREADLRWTVEGASMAALLQPIGDPCEAFDTGPGAGVEDLDILCAWLTPSQLTDELRGQVRWHVLPDDESEGDEALVALGCNGTLHGEGLLTERLRAAYRRSASARFADAAGSARATWSMDVTGRAAWDASRARVRSVELRGQWTLELELEITGSSPPSSWRVELEGTTTITLERSVVPGPR